MIQLRSIITVLVLTHLATVAPAAKPQLDQTARLNVVILLSDDLGTKDLGCYGGLVKTPVLDSLAARGVKFTDFHAGAAICSPSRATLLTGRQHLRTGIYGVLQDHMHIMHLLEREVTIAEVLQKAGYGTAHFGKWHIGMTSGKRKKPSPTEHGFDYWFGLSNGAQPNHKDPTNFMRNGKRVGPMQGYSCQIVVSDAINWLETRDHPEQPFFLNIWFNEPHAKIAAPDDIVSIYGDLKDEAAIYSATIDNTDRAIGRLVTKLKETGQLDNTLIIYSSDHGSYRPDRNGGLNGNKGSNFEGGLRSPGIFFWPQGIRGGRIERTPSGSVDLLPTICGLAGIDKPEGVHLDGADLSPLLTEQGKFTRAQPLLWLAPSSGHLATLRDGRYTLMGYRGYDLPFEREKLNAILQRMAKLAGIDPSPRNLLTRVSNTTFTSPEYRRLSNERVRLQTFQESWIPIIKQGGFRRFALYDLESDPRQKKDISRQRPKVTARLKEKLLELYQDVMSDAPRLADYRTPYIPPPAQPADSSKPAHGNTSSAQRASAMPAQGNALGNRTLNNQPQRGGPKVSDAPLGLSKSRAGNPGHRPGLTYGRPVGPAKGKTPAPDAKDADLDKLLKKIEATDLPKGYHGSTHQAYVDQRMAGLTPQQRQRIGRLWNEKRHLHPNMKNVGGSFVKIMEFVAAGKDAKEGIGTKP